MLEKAKSGTKIRSLKPAICYKRYIIHILQVGIIESLIKHQVKK